MNGQEPDITRRDPKAYYYYLVSQGMPKVQAMQLVDQRFGGGQTPQERQRQEAKDKQTSGLAQTGGAIAGMIAGRYVMNNAGKWIDSLTGAETTKEVVNQAAQQAGQQGFATSGTIGIQRPVPPPTTTVDGSGASVDLGGSSAMPEVIATKGDLTTVNTPAGPQDVPTESLNDPSFWNNVNWGQVVQGGLALAQMYGAYKSYQSGDKTGAAITGAAAAGNLAASGALGASAAGTASSAAGGYLIPGLNIVAGAYGGYQTAEALSDMAAGSKRTQTGVVGGAASGAAIGGAVGSIIPGVGTAIGAGVGALIGATAGAVGSWTGSSKGKAQMMRDNIRGALQEGGILDKDFKGTLADGSTYDFGKDGSTLKWKNIDKIAEQNPNAWNAAVPAADALAAAYGFVGQKASDIAAWYAKGAVSNAKDDPNTALANMQHFAKQQGITYDMIKQKLDEAKADNRVNEQMYNKYLTGAQQLTGGAGPNVTTPTQEKVARPKKGQVARVSPGMYMDSSGRVGRESEMRKSLERNMRK